MLFIVLFRVFLFFTAFVLKPAVEVRENAPSPFDHPEFLPRVALIYDRLLQINLT